MTVVSEQTTTRSPRRGRRRAWVSAAVLVMLTAGCGSQTSAKDLRALLKDSAADGAAIPAAATAPQAGSATPSAEAVPTGAEGAAPAGSGAGSSTPIGPSAGGLTPVTRAASASAPGRPAAAQSATAGSSGGAAPKTA
ncbi:MAG TPA: hypothetical protein VGP90_14645, partial [Acidimicrobiia bacterium]|nr:hypothetical protein [Acidimicrobiia bacterium]